MFGIRLVGGMVMFAIICQMWVSRAGLLRTAWNQRGISRPAAMLVSLAGLMMCVGGAIGDSSLFNAGWLVALPACIVIFFARRR